MYRFHFSGEQCRRSAEAAITRCGHPGAARKSGDEVEYRSNTYIAPSHSSLLALLNTLLTPPCLSPSVFILQLDYFGPGYPCLASRFQLILNVLCALSRISIGTEKTPEAAIILPPAPIYGRSLLVHLARSPCASPTAFYPRTTRPSAISLLLQRSSGFLSRLSPYP